MNTRTDDEISKREDQIRAAREAAPCNRFGAMSKSIPLCDLCGWDFDAHIDKAHDEALELDAEGLYLYESKKFKENLRGFFKEQYGDIAK